MLLGASLARAEGPAKTLPAPLHPGTVSTNQSIAPPNARPEIDADTFAWAESSVKDVLHPNSKTPWSDPPPMCDQMLDDLNRAALTKQYPKILLFSFGGNGEDLAAGVQTAKQLPLASLSLKYLESKGKDTEEMRARLFKRADSIIRTNGDFKTSASQAFAILGDGISRIQTLTFPNVIYHFDMERYLGDRNVIWGHFGFTSQKSAEDCYVRVLAEAKKIFKDKLGDKMPKIVLAGFSNGGDAARQTALDVASKVYPVDLLYLVDPVTNDVAKAKAGLFDKMINPEGTIAGGIRTQLMSDDEQSAMLNRLYTQDDFWKHGIIRSEVWNLDSNTGTIKKIVSLYQSSDTGTRIVTVPVPFGQSPKINFRIYGTYVKPRPGMEDEVIYEANGKHAEMVPRNTQDFWERMSKLEEKVP